MDVEGAPIPLRFDYEDNRISIALDDSEKNIIYRGYRPQDSLTMHEDFSKSCNYPYKFPEKSQYPLLEVIRECLAPK